MSINTCKACGEPDRIVADTCQHCGTRQLSWLQWIYWSLLLLGMFVGVLSIIILFKPTFNLVGANGVKPIDLDFVYDTVGGYAPVGVAFGVLLLWLGAKGISQR